MPKVLTKEKGMRLLKYMIDRMIIIYVNNVTVFTDVTFLYMLVFKN